jgi:Dolichyl-phosphate-mannose-protein mannosyltransferase
VSQPPNSPTRRELRLGSPLHAPLGLQCATPLAPSPRRRTLWPQALRRVFKRQPLAQWLTPQVDWRQADHSDKGHPGVAILDRRTIKTCAGASVELESSAIRMLRTLVVRLAQGRHRYIIPGILVAALGLRLALILAGWPETDSDEGTMGLEALHIFQRGEHPIFLYGQNYMGVAEAYLGAAMYRLFGVSLVSLRLGMLLLFGVFLVGLYALARLLYGRAVALVSVALLALGATDVMRPELLAVGGAAETLVSGTLLFALASWLALTPRELWISRAGESWIGQRCGHASGSAVPHLRSTSPQDTMLNARRSAQCCAEGSPFVLRPRDPVEVRVRDAVLAEEET